MPWSSAVWTIRSASTWGTLVPKRTLPRQSGETRTPLLPRTRYSINENCRDPALCRSALRRSRHWLEHDAVVAWERLPMIVLAFPDLHRNAIWERIALTIDAGITQMAAPRANRAEDRDRQLFGN